ncbi:hypothetical protein F4680DRAFT_448262 [Xylaria scruposa]|nr:hypothetical protein F4680DRAFT_448262 [Xylaria scruposa]
METTGFSETQLTVREAINQVCSGFPNTYWQERDQTEQDPKDFHAALARDGWLGIALPEALGGSGLGISEATIMMQTITESGAGMAGAQAIHANVYATQPLAKFGTKEQLESTIPNIISGKWRVCFGVTEPNAGLNTLGLSTTASKQPDGSYRISGQKIWITCAQVASKMILLARTTPLEEVKRPSEGLSLFCIDLNRDQPGLDMRKIRKLGGRAVDANEVFFDNYTVPGDSLIGQEGQGFKIILHGMNAERCLLAGEALGLGYAALNRAAQYARDRVVFGRPIGQNQAIAHPLADAYMKLESAKLATYHAARLYDESSRKGESSRGDITPASVGVACNSAKYMAAEAAFTACERAVLTHGGMGYAAEYPRKSKLAQREAAAARTLQEFADGVIPEARPAATETASPSVIVTPLPDSIISHQDNRSPRSAAIPTARASVASQSGNLFFGESNFLTLVPRPPHDGDELPAPNAQRSAQMTFPIPHTPQSAEHISTASPQSLYHMSASAERYLRDEGALKFPELSSCLLALEAYFTWFHPAFPILDQLDIHHRVKSMTISPILLQAILFTAATYCSDSVITSMGFADRSEAKYVLYTRARLLFHADVEKDGATLIQALFLLSFWRGGPSDTRDVRYWLGVAITLAESHGYHRSARFTTNNPHIARMRRRMWWSIYVRERQAAASLGVPSRIRDDDCDNEALEASDLTSETYSEPHLISFTVDHVTYATKMVEISRLLGKIIDLHFTPGRTTGFTEEVENLSFALNNWKQSLPNNIRWEDDENAPSVWKYLLHLAYNHLCILVHRNGFLRHTSGTERDIVIRAASRISRIAEDMLSQEILQITSFFTALCVHAISLRTATGLEKTITLYRGQMCLMSLKEIQKYWKINNNLLDLFLKYLDGSIAERLHGSGMEGREESTARPSTSQEPQESSVSLTLAAEPQTSVSYQDGEERTDGGFGNLQIHTFQPNMGSLGDGLFDLGLYLDSQGTMDDEMQFEGFNFLHRAL